MGDSEKWAMTLPDEFVFCRDTSLGHDWQPVDAMFDESATMYVRVIMCARCDSTKEQHLDTSGHITRRKAPKYTEGYLRPKGTGRMTKDDNADLRLESLVRVMNKGGKKK